MRFLFTTVVLTAGAAIAADAPKEFQYLDGNIAGIEQNVMGSMNLDSVDLLVLEAPTGIIEIPYAAVTKSEHKVAPSFDEKEPLYKFWALGKRLMPQLPIEHVTLQFTDKSGKAALLTLEMYQQHAAKIVARVEKAQARTAANQGAFWGDRVWKTKRNQDSWGGAGTVATRE
jgi:hypothetical protein